MPLFPLGQIVATPAALDVVSRRAERDSEFTVGSLIRRHHAGDWGDIDAHDQKVNADALKYGNRLMSVYGEGRDRLYVITEADRSITTVLTPADY